MSAGINFKIVLLGAWGVGKTSLARKFVHERFSADYLPTIGANILVKSLTINRAGVTKKVILSIWDLAGEQEFAPVRMGYYFGARGALLLGDLTRKETFEDLRRWKEELHQVSPRDEIPIVLLGNKKDLKSEVTDEHLVETGRSLGVVGTIKTSALTGENVDSAFYVLTGHILDQMEGKSGSEN